MTGTGNVSNVRSFIAFLDIRIKYHNRRIDSIQDRLNDNPYLPTDKLEYHFHAVKTDLSSIRKLESFLLVYDSSYIRKKEYPGEERDNVNTYR